MATTNIKISLLQGLSTSLDTLAIKAGQILFCTDTKEIYLDVIPAEDAEATRIRLYDGLAADITSLKSLVGNTSVATQIANAIGELKIGDETFATVKAYVDKKTDGIATDVALETLTNRVTTAEGKIDKLNGDETTEGSIAKQIKDAIDALTIPEYTIEKAATAETGFVSTYRLMKDGVQVGASINIAKDKFLKEVSIVDEDEEGNSGKFIKMVFEDDTGSIIYLNINDLVDVYTSGSAAGDMIVIAIDSTTNKITATITNGTITKAKLTTAIQDSLNLADSAVQPSELAVTKEDKKYIAGITVSEDGTITIEKETLPDPDLTALEWGSF